MTEIGELKAEIRVLNRQIEELKARLPKCNCQGYMDLKYKWGCEDLAWSCPVHGDKRI